MGFGRACHLGLSRRFHGSQHRQHHDGEERRLPTYGPSPLMQAMQGLNRPACREPISSVAVAIAEFPAWFQEIACANDWICRNVGAATEYFVIGRCKRTRPQRFQTFCEVRLLLLYYNNDGLTVHHTLLSVMLHDASASDH